MRSTPEPHATRPLSGLARLTLSLTTAVTIAVFYLFILVSLTLLLAWIGLMCLVALAAARVGATGLVARYIERDLRLVMTIGRALWLKESATYNLPLQRADAPRLFAIVEALAVRFGIPPPDELCLEMTSGAWVELRGFRTGLGRTRVGVGYDLLAALSEREVEAVMAHELAHAKLIGRAVHNWLARGFNRAARVSNRLSADAEAHRRADMSFRFGTPILAVSDWLTRWCARQRGARSRQNEFEADRGAAEMCGAAAIRSALLRLEAIEPKLERLPWNERVARIESPDGLSAWLLQELADATPSTHDAGAAPAAFDRYSTHPPLADRIAALPADESQFTPSPSGLGLLAAPDRLALDLVAKIQQTALQEEREELRDLRRWLRRTRSSTEHRGAQLPGMLMIMVAAVIGVIALCMDARPLGAVLLLVFVPLGVWFYRLGYYRDKRPFPVPAFPQFMNARKDFPLPDLDARQKAIEEDLRKLTPFEARMPRKAALLVEEAYAALAKCDYLRAHVAARLAADFDKNSLERALAMMVAAAAFNQNDVVGQLFDFVRKKTALRSPASTWASAWALLLLADWHGAEALLHETMKARPDDRDLLSILAFCQGKRGKLQSAIANARAVCTPRAPSDEALTYLVSFLLHRGALREAAERLEEFSATAASSPEVIELRMRYHLLRHDMAAAEKQLAMLDLSTLPGPQLIALGELYENARVDAQAQEFYNRALGRAHYPAACLGLARLATAAKNPALARHHIHAALDTTKTTGENAASAFDLFQTSLNQLMTLERPVGGCRAWISTFRPGVDTGALAKSSLVIFAPSATEAHGHLQQLSRALNPNLPPLAASAVTFAEAPSTLQPDRPVRPGVQYVYQ